MPPPRGLVQRLDQELHRSGLLPRGARLLVGVSGGADSVALLRLLHAINGSAYWGWTLCVGHVEHGIRGRASVADARFVQRLAATLDLPCSRRTLKLGPRASEQTAREARLAALQSILRQRKCDLVVFAHHADDQAETVLLRLMRGCGIDGLGAMAQASEIDGLRICRPLLGVRREALREYLKAIGQGWREDRSNTTPVYLRNRVRAEILPRIEELAPGAVEAIARTATLAQEVQRIIEGQVDQLEAAAMVKAGPQRVELRRAPLRAADGLLCCEVIRRAIRRVGGSSETADFERLREAAWLIQGTAGGKQIQAGRGVVIRLSGQRVIVERRSRRS